MPKIVDIHRRNGVAGQVAYRVTVDHGPDNGGQTTCELVGSTYGSPGPVVMITSVQSFVTDPGQYGETFDRDWIRRFFA